MLDLRGCCSRVDAGLGHLAAVKNLERLKLRNRRSPTQGSSRSAMMTELIARAEVENSQITDDGLTSSKEPDQTGRALPDAD